MRLGLWQCASPAGDVTAGLAEVETALQAAAAQDIDILTLPEVLLPGYNADQTPAPQGLAEALDDIPSLVAKHGVALVLGVADHRAGQVYNTAIAYDRAGAELARYDKVQLFGPREAAIYTQGDRLVTFNFEGTRFGLLICYDVEFPEHTRALARAGAEVLLVPTANMMPFVNVNEVLVPARALESGLTVVYANYCGAEGDLTYSARSVIAGPDGRVQADAGQGAGLIWADLRGRDDPGLETPSSTQLADLRGVTPS